MTDKKLKIQDASTDALRPYADLADGTGKTPAADSAMFSFWNDLSVGDVSGAPVSFGMVKTKPGELTAPMVERHLKTTETLVPLDEDIILVLAKPSSGDSPDLDTLAAFRVQQGTAITLKKGTWHYIPLIAGKKQGRTLVVFRQGTPDDDLQVYDVLKNHGVRVILQK